MVDRTLRLASTSSPRPDTRQGMILPPFMGRNSAEPALKDFQQLGLTIVRMGAGRVQLTGCFADCLDLHVIGRPHEAEDDPAPLVWDVLGRWRRPRRLCVVPSELDEWLGLCSLDAFALLRGLRNDAVAESFGPAATEDGFDHGGNRVINPFRDRFGNETSPASEYGEAYRLWRACWNGANARAPAGKPKAHLRCSSRSGIDDL